jgi:hypothetical protein
VAVLPARTHTPVIGGSSSRRGSGDKPAVWQQDESAVRANACSFNVKYLGCVEVFESRGMQVCEEALKVLRVCLPVSKRDRTHL